MIDLKNIRDIIYQIFSDSGYVFNNMNIKFPQPLNIKVTKKDDTISLDFVNDCPKISWKRIITLSAHVNGLSLGKDGGTIKLRYLPDIDFSYDKTQEQLFGNQYDFSSIQQDIMKEYGDEERQKLANRCLQYGSEWATIASRSNAALSYATPKEQRVLKQQCKDFIRDNIANEKRHGSAILTFVLLYVLLPVILKFIVEKIFRKIFE
jgi:hypothetical protein